MLMLIWAGCGSGVGMPASSINPFTDLAPITLDGLAQPIESDIIALGNFDLGEVFHID